MADPLALAEHHLAAIEFEIAQLRAILAQRRVDAATTPTPIVTPVATHDGSVGVDARHDEPASRCIP